MAHLVVERVLLKVSLCSGGWWDGCYCVCPTAPLVIQLKYPIKTFHVTIGALWMTITLQKEAGPQFFCPCGENYSGALSRRCGRQMRGDKEGGEKKGERSRLNGQEVFRPSAFDAFADRATDRARQIV